MHKTTLKYFLTVAEELNITRAAEKLHLSQQALSTQIAKLEAEYSSVFFERVKTGLILTPEGRCFYDFALQSVRMEENTANKIAEIRHFRSGHVRVGMTMTRAVTLLPETFSRFAPAHPNVKVELTIASFLRSELEEKLIDRELDVIVTPMHIHLPAMIEAKELETGFLCLSIPRSFIETILRNDESAAAFAALPVEKQKRRLLDSGLLERIPFVYAARRVAQRARQFLRLYAPQNASVLDLCGYENIFGMAFCGHTAVFTHNSLARVSYDSDGAPDQFIYAIDVPESPFSIAAYYHKDTSNPAAIAFVEELLATAEKRRVPPPAEYFVKLD